MTSDGEDSKVHLRHRSGPLEGRGEVTQCKTKVQDQRQACVRNMEMKLGQDVGYIRLPLNEHANHECCCVVELKRNELSLLDDANHARNTDAADVAGGVRRGDWADGLTACEPARKGR